MNILSLKSCLSSTLQSSTFEDNILILHRATKNLHGPYVHSQFRHKANMAHWHLPLCPTYKEKPKQKQLANQKRATERLMTKGSRTCVFKFN